MTSSLSNGQKYRNAFAWLNYAMAILMVFSLTWPDALMLKVFFAWACTWVFDVVADKRYLRPSFSANKAPLFAAGAFFLLMLISFLYSDNMDYAMKVLERRLAFALLPLMAVFGFNDKYRLKPMLLAFVIGAMISLLFTLILPFADYLFNEEGRYLYQKSVSDQFVRIAMDFKHRSYFGIMQLMALVCLWYLRQDLSASWGKKSYWSIFGLYAFFILVHLLFLKGRTPLLALAALIIFAFASFLFKSKSFKQWGILLLLMLALAGGIGWTFYTRFHNDRLKLIEQTDPDAIKKDDSRSNIWQASMEILSEEGQWLFGVGSGDLKDKLDEKYAENGLSIKRRHAHNTMLNTWIELGLPGLLLVLFMLIGPFFSVKNKENRQFLLALAIPLYLLLMVEAFTQTIHGLLLWANFLLLCAYLDTSPSTNEESCCNNLAIKLKNTCFIILALMALLWLVFLKMDQGYNPRNPRTYAQVKHYKVEKQLPMPYPSSLDKCKGYKIEAGVESAYRNELQTAEFSSSVYVPSPAYKSFSVWCFVSEDFDGNEVLLQSFKRNGERLEYFFTSYHLQEKGQWQRLQLSVENLGNYAPCSFIIRKKGVENFDTLQGYVIFALPIFEK